ncbi:aquaporin [Streptomyces microflavus]|uniref:MIP/aquaporin family protein n=1 Tax=Streptomyces microflavus TaxID=1919 RepID=UPI0033D37825
MRSYAVEFIGTFFLVLTVGTAVLSEAPLAPLAIGAMLMVMVYAGGHVSGAHYNPAVTLAVLLRGRIGVTTAAGYVCAQSLAALAAGPLALWIASPESTRRLSLSGHQLVAALVVEALFAFALAYVVLNVATSSSHSDNSFYGLAIGFTVLAGAVTVGGISGAVFNPVVALGGALAGLFDWSALWIYLLANLAGGAAAGMGFRVIHPHDSGPLVTADERTDSPELSMPSGT